MWSFDQSSYEKQGLEDPVRVRNMFQLYSHRCGPLPTSKLISSSPKGPYTAHLRTLVPITIPGMVCGIKVLRWAVYEHFG